MNTLYSCCLALHWSPRICRPRLDWLHWFRWAQQGLATPDRDGPIMDHGRFKYSAIAKRPRLKLPNGARVAVWIVPNVEHFHYGKPAMSMTPMTMSFDPDVLNYAWRDYGARVGVWRVMEILERQGFRGTGALNSEVCEQYPEIVKEGNRLGWEWMAHGPSQLDAVHRHARGGRAADHRQRAGDDHKAHGTKATRVARACADRDAEHARPARRGRHRLRRRLVQRRTAILDEDADRSRSSRCRTRWRSAISLFFFSMAAAARTSTR